MLVTVYYIYVICFYNQKKTPNFKRKEYKNIIFIIHNNDDIIYIHDISKRFCPNELILYSNKK